MAFAPKYLPSVAVCGISASAVSLIIALGWLFGFPSLYQIGPNFYPVTFVSAVLFLLEGSALTALSVGRIATMLAICTVSSFVSSLLLVDWLFNLPVDFNLLFATHTSNNTIFRVPPNTALSVLLCSFSLISTQIFPRGSMVFIFFSMLPWLVVAQSIAGVLGLLLGLPQTYAWVSEAAMSPQSLVIALTLAMGSLSYSHLRTGETTLSVALYAVPMGSLFISFLFWYGMDRQQQRMAVQVTQTEATTAAARLQGVTERSIQAVERMAARWLRLSMYRSRSAWQMDAELILSHFTSIRGIAWIGPDHHIRWTAPRSEFGPYEGFDVFRDPRRREAITKARRQHLPSATASLELMTSDRGFVVFYPLYLDGGRYSGVLAAAFAYDRLIPSAISSKTLSDFALRIADGGESLFYGRTETDPNVKSAAATIHILDREWQITLTPSPEKASELHSFFPLAMLFLGAVCSLVIAFLLYFVLKSERQRQDLEMSERRFQLLLDGARDYGILLLDKEGRIQSWNEGGHQITGYRAEEILGRYFGVFYPQELQPHAPAQGLKKAAETGRFEETGIRVRKDGSQFWAHVVISTICDKNGKLTGYSKVTRDISNLRRTEERMQLALEATGIGIWDWDIQRQHVEWDAQVFRLYRLLPTVAPQTLEAWQAMLHPEDVASTTAAIQESLRNQTALDVEFRVRPGGSEQQYLRMIAHGIFDSQGQPLRMIGACIDITESKRLREKLEDQVEQLEQANTRFELISSGTSVGIWDWPNALEDKGYWSPNFYRILGYEDQEIEATITNFKKLLHPEDVGVTMTSIQNHLEGGPPFSIEHRMRTKSGEYRWFMGSGAASRDAHGKPTRMVGSLYDVHDRKVLEEALRETNTSFNQIMRSSGHMLISTDLNGTIRYFNPTAEQKLGYVASEVVGKMTPTIFHDAAEIEARRQRLGITDHPDDPFAVLVCKAAAGEAEQVEWSYIRKDGVRFPVLLTVTALTDSTGTITGYLGTAADLTEKKSLESRLQRALEARSVFLANMSHEIRTPMNGVIGMTSLLLQCNLPPEAREYAHTIRKSGELLLSVVNDILDISKIEAGKLTIEKTPMSIRQSIDHVVDLFGEMAESKGLVLCSLIDERVPGLVTGDSVRVQQVVSNLVSNAIKFTNQGAVIVRASCQNSQGRLLLKIDVSDTGIGMRSEVVSRLFEPFSQGDTSTTRRFGGTGLGLSISRRLVTLMGGEIRVTSEDGFGSTFSILLPCIAPAGEKPYRFPSFKDARIAVVSPQVHMRRAIMEILESVHCSQDTFPSLAQLEEVRASGVKYDAFILDGVAQRNAFHEDLKPAVILTAPLDTAPASNFKGIVLRKPLKQTSLVQALFSTLSGKLPRREPPATPFSHEQLVRLDGKIPYCLVAEDNPVNQKVMSAMLAKLGIRSRIVETGTQVLECLAKESFDLVLMDCFMPEMDGYEASRKIRASADPLIARMPIIAVTASATSEDRDKCERAGMDEYIAKPVQLTDLKKLLMHALQLRPQPPRSAINASEVRRTGSRQTL